MNYQLRIVVYKKKSIYDDAIITLQSYCNYKEVYKNKQIQCESIAKNCESVPQSKFQIISLRKKGFNAYLVSVYMNNMSRSSFYRQSAIKKIVNFLKANSMSQNFNNTAILIKLSTPSSQFIDYNWNERLIRMANERKEIDHAMSWLSTLGGAFSALGDRFDSCAKIAGKISVEQFKLSLRLGDPQLVARCELYASLSILQQGHFKITARMVRKIYKFAVNDKDVRLQRMCHGVWAKLQYCYKQHVKTKKRKKI